MKTSGRYKCGALVSFPHLPTQFGFVPGNTTRQRLQETGEGLRRAGDVCCWSDSRHKPSIFRPLECERRFRRVSRWRSKPTIAASTTHTDTHWKDALFSEQHVSGQIPRNRHRPGKQDWSPSLVLFSQTYSHAHYNAMEMGCQLPATTRLRIAANLARKTLLACRHLN